jgi:NAD(P)-dependent dehydrogenase (short-subunit alcohol dehydrogenase family)
MGKLDAKVAIITGGARGIGLATARSFVAEGAKVLLVDLHEADLIAAANELASENVAYFAADVSDEIATKAFAQKAIAIFGKIDILFANAGVEGEFAAITDYGMADFDKVMATNVRGAYLSVKYAWPELVKSGGNIIIVSSVAGLKGFANLSAYVISKHAIIGLMRTAALEGAPFGIRVNSIHPGPIETQMMRSIEHEIAPDNAETAKAAFIANIPFKRYGEAKEVADLALFLASNDSKYITGAIHVIDGGMIL